LQSLGVDLITQADLIVAVSDLKAVQLIRQAIAAADAATAKTLGPNTLQAQRIAARRRLECRPFCEPRRIERLQSKIEPRDTIHLQSRIVADPPAPAKEPRKPLHITAPFLPPWEMLPWKTTPQRPTIIKKVVQQIDIKNKGSLIDIFI
jgi:hypothetical protein